MHPVAFNFPFVSTFNAGNGLGMYINGEKVSGDSWYNISCQSIQPCSFEAFVRSSDGQYEQLDSLKVEHTNVLAYNGGTSLAVQGSLDQYHSAWCPLFLTDIPVAEDKVSL